MQAIRIEPRPAPAVLDRSASQHAIKLFDFLGNPSRKTKK